MDIANRVYDRSKSILWRSEKYRGVLITIYGYGRMRWYAQIPTGTVTHLRATGAEAMQDMRAYVDTLMK